MIPNCKGEVMLEKAEDISKFWAYEFSYSIVTSLQVVGSRD